MWYTQNTERAQRSFDNSKKAKGAEAMRIGMVLVAVMMLGLGCKKDAGTHSAQRADAGVQPTADAGSTVPKGWQWYTNAKDGYQIAYPPGWKVTTDGILYKDAPNLEQLLSESNGHFRSISQVAPASIFVAVFNPEGKTVDQLWEEQTARDPDTDRIVQVDGEYGRVGHCTGIRYYECLFAIHTGQAYMITMVDHGIVWSDNPELQQEIEQIINTFNFLP